MQTIYELIQTDLKKLSTHNSSWNKISLFIKFFISRSIRIIILVRLLKYNTKIISFLCSRILRRKCIEVSKASKIGTGVFFPHPWSIIVAGGVIIGDNVSIGQYVTIGGNF